MYGTFRDAEREAYLVVMELLRDRVILKDSSTRPGDWREEHVDAADACIEIPMPVFGYCLMPNHFLLLVRPHHDGDLSRWMHWVLNTHVRRAALGAGLLTSSRSRFFEW